MSDMADTMTRAIDDARALLGTLLSGGWQELHVVSGNTEIFIAREGGRPNPMRQALAAAAPPASTAAPQVEEVVTAPHVATVVDVLPVGTTVAAGERIATIRVLDGEEIVASPAAGRVAAIHAAAGALVEYKAPIVSLSGAAQ